MNSVGQKGCRREEKGARSAPPKPGPFKVVEVKKQAWQHRDTSTQTSSCDWKSSASKGWHRIIVNEELLSLPTQTCSHHRGSLTSYMWEAMEMSCSPWRFAQYSVVAKASKQAHPYPLGGTKTHTWNANRYLYCKDPYGGSNSFWLYRSSLSSENQAETMASASLQLPPWAQAQSGSIHYLEPSMLALLIRRMLRQED